MFIANKENFRHKLTNTDITRCLNSYYTTLYISKYHYVNMSWKATAFITIRKLVHILRIPTACSPTLSNFHLPPRYQTSNLDINISLNMATTIPLILVNKIYQHIINGTQHIMPFHTTDESTEDTDSIWTLFSHTGTYVTAIGSLIPAGSGIFCCFFRHQPAKLTCQPLQPGNMCYTIVDDDVKVAPIYRCNGKVLPPTRPCENHGLAIEHLPTQRVNVSNSQSH